MKTLPKEFLPASSNESFKKGPEIARHYQVTPETVRRWRRLGCPHSKKGYRLVLFKLSEVEAWLRRRN